MSMDLEEEYDKIYRYCYFKVANRETAEDITQETFLRFLESCGYEDRGKSLHYLYTIARNLCMDEFRSRRREVPISDGDSDALDCVGEVVPGGGEAAEDGLLTRLSLASALLELTEEERELLLLRHVNDISVTWIGKIYEISTFSVYRKLRQAEKKMRERL